jgi:hypothetical protein
MTRRPIFEGSQVAILARHDCIGLTPASLIRRAMPGHAMLREDSNVTKAGLPSAN